VVELTVEKGVYRGLGLARHGGQVVFVARALPGDRLRVRVETTSPGYANAVPEALLSPAPERRDSPCPYVPRCGGCAYQELEYPAQLRLKEAVLRESLRRAGAPWEGDIPVAGSPEEGWRMRASLHFGVVGDSLGLGLHEEATHRVVDLERCLQLSTRMNGAGRALLAALQERRHLWPHLRGLDLAESPSGDELVAALETDLPVREAAALGFMADAAPALTGFGVVVGRGRGERYLGLHGHPHVRARVLDLTLRAHVGSFFQANRFLVEALARAVGEAVGAGSDVLDLYAGVGLLSLPLAAGSRKVLAVEVSPLAVEDAKDNARRAGLQNVRIRQGEVLGALGAWPASAGEVVLLDPPRAGAGKEVVRAVAARRPERVVYVSCDPPTLGRDLAAFARDGYRADLVRAFDLFPDTFHLETVVRLTRRD
jgi:23S rRNA (uracil1939-C5)-methyltransferase